MHERNLVTPERREPQANILPLTERRQPRWLQIQQDRIAERERAGGSRYDAVADLTRSRSA